MLCTQRHKDSHLYGYILYFMSLLQQHKRSQSSILIFCNSIAGVRRVGLTLTTLRLPVRMLHANMQQVRVTDQIVVIFTCVCSGCAMWNVGREEDTNKPEREQGICILSKWPNIFLSITISMRALVNNLWARMLFYMKDQRCRTDIFVSHLQIFARLFILIAEGTIQSCGIVTTRGQHRW